MDIEDNMSGALVGWRHRPVGGSTVFVLQLATDGDQHSRKDYIKIAMVMNDRQLRSLARDLSRVAEERDLPLWGRRIPWYKFWVRGRQDNHR